MFLTRRDQWSSRSFQARAQRRDSGLKLTQQWERRQKFAMAGEKAYSFETS